MLHLSNKTRRRTKGHHHNHTTITCQCQWIPRRLVPMEETRASRWTFLILYIRVQSHLEVLKDFQKRKHRHHKNQQCKSFHQRMRSWSHDCHKLILNHKRILSSWKIIRKPKTEMLLLSAALMVLYLGSYKTIRPTLASSQAVRICKLKMNSEDLYLQKHIRQWWIQQELSLQHNSVRIELTGFMRIVHNT